MNECKPDTVGMAHKTLDAALAQARIGRQTGEVAVKVNIRGGIPSGTPTVRTELTAPEQTSRE